MSQLIYRSATEADLPAIVEIYNSTVASRMVTADTEPVTVASKLSWFNAHTPENRPLWLVEDSNNKLIGWVSFQSFYGRPAYQATAEISIYLHENFRKKGYGKEILVDCLQKAPDLGIKTLLGFIFTHNLPSLELFFALGFETWGTLPEIAEMDQRLYSLTIVGKRIS